MKTATTQKRSPKVGDHILYRGDRANLPHIATVTELIGSEMVCEVTEGAKPGRVYTTWQSIIDAPAWDYLDEAEAKKHEACRQFAEQTGHDPNMVPFTRIHV